jgi:two-component system response regulator
MLEHDDDDRYITDVVMRESGYAVDIHFVESSNDLFAFLISCERMHLPLPSVILMSYNAMRADLIETITSLRQNRQYTHIPIVVLGGVVDPSLVSACYTAGANSFIRKPSSASEITGRITSFLHYWFDTVVLPGETTSTP